MQHTNDSKTRNNSIFHHRPSLYKHQLDGYTNRATFGGKIFLFMLLTKTKFGYCVVKYADTLTFRVLPRLLPR